MSLPEHRIELRETPDEERREALLFELRSHDAAHAPEHWEALGLPENEPLPLELFALDRAGEVLGGLLARSQLAWLWIEALVVVPELRRQGLGTALLERAEDEARARGCRHVRVQAPEHRSPGFFRARGFREAGRLEDADSFGHAELLLVKDL